MIGTVHRDAPLTEEIVSRTSPNLFDLMIAYDVVPHDVVPHSADIVIAIITVAWWYLAALLTVRLVRHVSPRFLFPFDVQPRRRKIISDLVSGLIYLGAVFGILKFGLHQPIVGLLATSGIVALVLGLALQSTLADLFSGIALNIEDPFRAGDWKALTEVTRANPTGLTQALSEMNLRRRILCAFG